jgi:putative tricarboxylic transport membrane protein
MSEVISNLAYGLDVALSPENLLFCLIGAVLGTLIGVLPGMSPVIVLSMLLPITFKMHATAALIMLAGVYYGSHHSGATSAIMLNMPSEPSSLVICFDGHPMARQGRAGPALAVAALASFFAGCVSVILVGLFSSPIANVALQFQAPEYTSVVLLALVAQASVLGKSMIRTMGMSALGILLGTVGTDVNTGTQRFTFGDLTLADGLEFVAVAVGMFAITEIGYRLGLDTDTGQTQKLTKILPSTADLLAAWKPILRGTALGSVMGIFPGTGPTVSSLATYALERGLAKDKTRFGNGAIEGVAGPEAADNAATITHFIPMLTFGIPAGAVMALLLGALAIQGIQPGPSLITEHPDLFWGVIASMLVGNMMLLILNLPLIGIWVKLLQTPYRLLYPVILTFCCIGIYSVRHEVFDVLTAAAAGALGFGLRRVDCPGSAVVFGLILGPMLEENLRRSLLMSEGDPAIFVTRPISLAFLIGTAALVVFFSLGKLRNRANIPDERRPAA